MQYLFSYGTLQLPQVQIATYGQELKGHADVLVGYRLEKLAIQDNTVVACSGLAVHPVAIQTGQITDEVTGIVFSLTDEQLLETDKYEVSDYKRELVILKSGKQAWVYIANT